MSRLAVARTYADTLLELAGRDEAADEYLRMLGEIAALYESAGEFRAFLHTPRIAIAEKRGVLRATLGDRYPELFVRFLLVVLEKRRHGLLPEIEQQCRDLLNERTGRVHAAVTLTVDPSPDLRAEIEDALSRTLERTVIADFRRDPRLIGGMVVRVKDRVLDGSLRRRMQLLRRSLVEETAAATGSG